MAMSVDPPVSMKCTPLSKGPAFALLGKAGAYSECHMDAEGGCSAIEVVTGIKVWAVRTSAKPISLKEFKHWHQSDEWDVALLVAGDIM
jgi:hypothetical protein